ncbi:MAG TPA: SCO family protein [Thermoanaerobaculia bacterium]|nr:SCO family protein [Thermoanaerobaculia bacterium]
MNRRSLLALAAAAALLAAAPDFARAQAAPAATPDARPAVLREVGVVQRLGQSLPLDAIFQDEAGRAVRLGQYFGKRPVILVLAYYDCPMLCTEVLNGLLSSLKTLSFDAGKQFEVVTVSFDPREKPADAAAKKKPYIEAYGRPDAADGWHFLTGGEGSIERVTSAVGFRYKYDESAGQFAHAAAIYIATADGKLSRYFYGIDYAPRDLRLGLIEASQKRIGTPVDQILLYCYHYDPKVGRYGAVVMNVVRLAGAGTVAVMAFFLLVMWRRERRRPRPSPVHREARSEGRPA